MSSTDFNALSEDAFVARFGGVFEHSPWVVERAVRMRPFADLHAGLMALVHAANRDDQLALIRAHPELAGKAKIDVSLTAASAAEQAGAGLDRLSPPEFARFHALNAAYVARFAFPFIICVRLTDKPGILAAMERRLGADREGEMATALAQIGEIVRLRLADLNPVQPDAQSPAHPETTIPAHPELVEGLPCSSDPAPGLPKEMQPFDKLRVNGCGVDGDELDARGPDDRDQRR